MSGLENIIVSKETTCLYTYYDMFEVMRNYKIVL